LWNAATTTAAAAEAAAEAAAAAEAEAAAPLSQAHSVYVMGRFGKVLGQKGQNVSSLFVPIFSSERSLGVKTHRRLELRALIAGAIRPR
jgi:hypothetical protein